MSSMQQRMRRLVRKYQSTWVESIPYERLANNQEFKEKMGFLMDSTNDGAEVFGTVLDEVADYIITLRS